MLFAVFFLNFDIQSAALVIGAELRKRIEADGTNRRRTRVEPRHANYLW